MILRVISISLLLFISSDHISCQEFDFLHLKDKNRTSIERAGDLFQIAIPIAGLAYTYYSDDVVGRKQFWKSYLSSLSVTYFLKYTGTTYIYPSFFVCRWSSVLYSALRHTPWYP